MIDYKRFIEKSFDIVGKDGKKVPFILNPVQVDFIATMSGKDIVLKARQQGFSSLILAIFLTDFLTQENSRSVIISHEAGATIKLLDRAKFFLDSLIAKGVDIRLKYNSRSELVNETKNSSLYVSTARSGGLLRGETISNLHFSEPAYYGNDAEAVCLGAMQAVTPNGRIVYESTANGYGNFFHREWERSVRQESNFRSHFYGRDFYDKDFLELKRKEFADEQIFNQEYPDTAPSAFISTGRPFFNMESLEWYQNIIKPPIKVGYLLPGTPPIVDNNPRGFWKFWQLPQEGESYLISCDVGEISDYSCAGILRQRTNEVVGLLHGHIDAAELALNLVIAGRWFNDALVAPEKNGLGMGVLVALKGLSYDRIYTRRSFDRITNKWAHDQGWLTTSSSRPLILSELQSAISSQALKIYDKTCINEMKTFYRDEKTGKPQAQPGTHDDRVMMLAILARLSKEINIVEDDSFDEATFLAQNEAEMKEFANY